MENAVRLFSRWDASAPEVLEMGGVSAVCYSHRSPERDTCNEDSAILIPISDHAIVVAVADGVGGEQDGAQASAIALEALSDSINQSSTDPDQLRVAILNGIERANEQILALKSGSCTTLAVVEFNAGEIRPYHVGDSVILVCSNRGRVIHQAVPHSPVGFAVESGLLDENEAMHHDQRHIVSNVVGDENMRIELGPPIQMAPRDTVLLASDGLSDNVPLDDIVSTICKGPLLQSAHAIVNQARDHMQNSEDAIPSKPDDLTILAFRIN